MTTFPNGSRPISPGQAVRQLARPPLLINHSCLPLEPCLWLRAWLTSAANYPVERLDESLPIADISLTISQRQAHSLLLYTQQILNFAQTSKLLKAVRCPTFVIRAAVCFHLAELSAPRLENPNVYLTRNPLAVQLSLARQGVT
jgi:hypothetical protein